MEVDKLATLRASVDRVLACAGDPEGAHGLEDALMRAYIRVTAPTEMLAEFERLWTAEFPRWCA